MTDESVLTFGQFKGEKLANVPAWYLLWCLEKLSGHEELKRYIRDHEDILIEEQSRAKNGKG